MYLAARLMKKKSKPYTIASLFSAVLMILSLLWLTVSLPFVYESAEQLAKQERTEHVGSIPTPEEESNPFGNTTEEKSPTSTTVSEEYIHDHHKSDYFFSIISSYHKCENADTYIAYHGELLVPPLNFS